MQFEVSNLVFFGVNLVPFILGLVLLLRQETNLPNYVLDWVGALLMAVASVLAFTEVQALLVGELTFAGLDPRARAELVTKVLTTFLGVLLLVKGYWPTVRERTLPSSVRDVFGGREAQMAGESSTRTPMRHRFFGKY